MTKRVMDEYVQAELVDVIEAIERTGQIVGIMLLSVEEWGDNVLPIIIGAAETASIKKGLGQLDFPRPLTHDLFVEVLETLGAQIEKVTIDSMINNVYTATLYIKDRDGKVYTFDSRPSDAVALAVRVGAPIFVARTLQRYAEPLSKFSELRGGGGEEGKV